MNSPKTKQNRMNGEQNKAGICFARINIWVDYKISLGVLLIITSVSVKEVQICKCKL